MFKLHSYKPSNYVLELIFVVNIKSPQATYHTVVPSTEELYCLNSKDTKVKGIKEAAETGFNEYGRWKATAPCHLLHSPPPLLSLQQSLVCFLTTVFIRL